MFANGRIEASCNSGPLRGAILVVTNMYPDRENPDFGTFVQEQVDEMRLRGLDVDVLIVGGKRRKLSYVEGTRRFLTHIRRRDYDLIHAHYVFSGVIARLQRKTPLVVSFHGGGEMVGWVGWLCRALTPLADAVTVTSLEHKARLKLKDAHVIPCGVDFRLFRPLPMEVARRRLSLSMNKKIVLFAGIPRPEKRLDLIQSAIDRLRRNEKNVELVVATGLPHRRIPLYMNASDVLVLASDEEGSPVVVKEAMACNLPIVSVDVGDVGRIIGDTEGCRICRRDPEDMASALGVVLKNRKRTNGRDAIRHLSLDITVDALLGVYRGLW